MAADNLQCLGRALCGRADYAVGMIFFFVHILRHERGGVPAARGQRAVEIFQGRFVPAGFGMAQEVKIKHVQELNIIVKHGKCGAGKLRQKIEYEAGYYSASCVEAPSCDALAGNVEAEVCVIGAGFAGLSCALELARAGIDVVVLEGARAGWGASGRNGGFVSPGYAQNLRSIIASAGVKGARELFDLSREGGGDIRRNIARYNMPGVDPVPGYLHVQRHEGGREFLNHQNLLGEVFDYPIQILDRGELAAHVTSRRYHHGWYEEKEAFHLHPLNYAIGLAKAAAGEGVRIFEGSKVVSFSDDGKFKSLETRQGSVRAKHAVFCTSAYMKGVFAPLASAILPVATYVVVKGPISDEVLAGAVHTSAAIVDTRRASDYYRIVEGNRLLWGGRITTRKSEPGMMRAMMMKDIVKVYPQLHDLRIDFAWSGLMGYARHKMPLIGQPRPGIWVASAFGGHGINTASIGGRLIAEAIARQSDRYRLFAPFKARWAGGPAGRIAVQLSYWKMQALDRLKEF